MHGRFKLLLWKVLWDIIPIKCKLVEHFGREDTLEDELQCTLCGAGMKTLHHLLHICPYNRVIWSESKWQINIVAFGGGLVGD